MSEKRGRGQPKFEPTPDQRSQGKLMKAMGIPEDRAFAAELESGAVVHPCSDRAGRRCMVTPSLRRKRAGSISRRSTY
jgi:hypothetical protein